MSEAHDTIADIVDDRASATTDPVFNVTSGATFTAEIETNIDAVIVMTELERLGEDAREMVLLHVRNAVDAAGINVEDVVRFKLLGVQAEHRIIKRRDNSGTPFTSFWASRKRKKDA